MPDLPLGILHRAWCKETSADPDYWSETNPAWGQCAVTALVAQDILGGKLLRGLVNGESHYWNQLPTGVELDLTRQQFAPGLKITAGTPREREYVLSFPETVRRYELLKQRIELLRLELTDA